MLQETHAAEIETLLARYADSRSAVLPLLYLAQDTYGTITTDVIREVAGVLDMPYTDVFEVVGFYTLFYDHPVGKWVVQVCDDVPCCYLGAEELLIELKRQLNVRENQPTDDGMFLLQRVKCLATCQRAPVVQANLSYFYDVTAARADALLRHLREHVDTSEAASISGRFAEDYEPAPDGSFRQIERNLGVLTPPQSAGTTVPEGAKKENGEAASVPAQPAQQAAEQQAESESPVAPEPDRAPASAHPTPEKADEQGAVPPTPAQQTPPEEESSSAQADRKQED